MSIEDKIREACQKCGKTQQELAKSARISQPAVSNFLKGGHVHSETLERLARAAGKKLQLSR